MKIYGFEEIVEAFIRLFISEILFMAWEIQQIMKDREIDVCGIWGQSDLYDFSCVCDEIVNKLHSLYDFPEKTPNDYIFRVIFSVFLKKKS